MAGGLAAVQLAIETTTVTAKAATVDEPDPCLFTQLKIEVTESGDNVFAMLTNTFTFLSSTVEVSLYLYSSAAKTTDVTQMTIEGTAYSSDLNMNESITVTASKHSEERYWVGYAIYYKDSGNEYYQTDPALY